MEVVETAAGGGAGGDGVALELAWESAHWPGALVENETSVVITCLPGKSSAGSSEEEGGRWRRGGGSTGSREEGQGQWRGGQLQSAGECRRACDDTPWCYSWTFEPPEIERDSPAEAERECTHDKAAAGCGGRLCVLMDTIEPASRRKHAWSGVKGRWSQIDTVDAAWVASGKSKVAPRGLHLSRAEALESAASGDFAVVGLMEPLSGGEDGGGGGGGGAAAAAEGAGGGGAGARGRGVGDGAGCGEVSSSCGIGDSLKSLWRDFASTGSFAGAMQCPDVSSRGRGGAVGALQVSSVVAPGASLRLGLVFSWHLPHRWHANSPVGNYYTNLFDNASHVAARALASEEHLLRTNFLWNQAVHRSGLSLALRHLLLNSLGTFIKTGVWTADGRWRQFESFSCNDLEPVHLHVSYLSMAWNISLYGTGHLSLQDVTSFSITRGINLYNRATDRWLSPLPSRIWSTTFSTQAGRSPSSGASLATYQRPWGKAAAGQQARWIARRGVAGAG